MDDIYKTQLQKESTPFPYLFAGEKNMEEQT